MWCSEFNWKLTPTPCVFKTSGNLNSSAHSLLFCFHCADFWWSNLRPLHTALSFLNITCVHREATFSRTVHFQACGKWGRPIQVFVMTFLIGPEVLACDCFTPGLWLSVGDGGFSENWTVENDLSLTWSYF